MSMAHALGMPVVAEGAKTAEQLASLQALSYDEVQGYFIARPVPAHDIASLLMQPELFALTQAARLFEGCESFAVAEPV